MHKKIIMACMAIAAFAAFVVAPAASASPQLVETTGGPTIPVGASITAKNTGNTVFSGSGLTIECSTAHLVGTVTENSGTMFKGEIPIGSANFSGTGASGDCTSNLGSASATVNSKLCIENITPTDTITVTGCGANVVFSLSVTGTGICKYSTASVTGEFTTNADATVKITNQGARKVEGGIFCPGEGVLNMDFDLQTTDGTTIRVE